MFRFIFQFGAATLVFLFAMLAAWYEGSALLDRPSEWRTTTPFTQWFHGPVQTEQDILQWDFFIYAAKYQPTYPMIMLVSGLYILLLLGYYLFRRVKKWYAYYLFFLSCGLFLLSLFHFSIIRDGYKMLILLITCACFCLFAGLIFYLTATIKMRKVSMKKMADVGD